MTLCKKTRDEYKEATDETLKWLWLHARGLNVNPFAIPPPPHPEKTKGKGKQKGGKQQRQPKEKAQWEPPTRLECSKWKTLGRNIYDEDPDPIQPDILARLAVAILLRWKFAYYYASMHEELAKENKKHQNFIETLAHIQSYLVACPSKRSDSSDFINLLAKMEGVTLKDWEAINADFVQQELLLTRRGFLNVNSFETTNKLSIPARVDDEWLPPELKKRQPSAPVEERPASEFAMIPDEEDASILPRDEEFDLAVWSLFEDMLQMRKYLQTIWEDYQNGTIHLITASFLTSQAVEIVKEMEADFYATTSIPPEEGYAGVIAAALGVYLGKGSPKIHLSKRLAALEKREDIMSFLMFFTWLNLADYSQHIQPSHTTKPKNFVLLNSAGNRDDMSTEERRAEDEALFHHYFSFLHNLAALFPRANSPIEEALVIDFRTYVKDPSHRIPIHLVFQLEVWKNIALLNRRSLETPLNEMRAIVGNISNAAKDWLNDFDKDAVIYHWGSGSKELKDSVRTNVIEHGTKPALEDPVYGFLASHGKHDLELPHYLLYHPWGCGIVAARVLYMAGHMGMDIVNGGMFLSVVLQLHHAFLQLGHLTEPWPLLQRIFDVCAHNMFKGPPPGPGKFWPGYGASAGRDPSPLHHGKLDPRFVGKGTTTGVFPQKPMGGSLSGKIALTLKFKLNDNVLRELFPRDETNQTLSRQSGVKYATATHQSRFGINRIDPYTLMETFKKCVEKDLKESGLALDLFNAQRICISILRRWHTRTKSIFQRIYGDQYLSRGEQDLTKLVGRYFDMLENDGGDYPTISKFTPDDIEVLTREAVRAIQEARKEVESSKESGVRESYLDI